MKMSKLVFAGSMCVLLVVGACAPPVAQESGEIAAASDEWEAALNAGDIDTLVGMYTEDARLMAPNAPSESGLEAVRAAFGAMIDAGLTIELDSVAAMAAGDLGHNIGTYQLTAPDGAVADRGKFLEVRRRVDGEWLIAADIWNSDMAAGAEGTTTLVGTHAVADFDHWYSAWQGEGSRHEMFAQHGVPSVRIFQNQDDPNLTGFILEVADIDAMQAMLASPEGQAAAAEDGVDMSTLRMYGEVE